MTTYMNAQQMDKAIQSIQKRGAQLDKDIQAAAVSALNHFIQHGDIVFVNRLYVAMPNGSRRSSLALWFMTFGQIEANKSETKKDVPFIKSKLGQNDLQGAEGTLWYEMKKDPDPDEIFDIKKALAALIAKAAKGKVNDPKLLEHLKALAPKVEA